MARKKPAPSGGANNAYLVSFGDTMTALLAFFIVLLSLAEEQTGANLYSGSGSFIQAIKGYGLPGTLTTRRTSKAFQKSDVGPLYVVGNDEDTDKDLVSLGPDDQSNTERIIQREMEDFQRFLYEMESSFSVDEVTETAHTTVFDLFEPLNTQKHAKSILPESALSVLNDAVSLTANENYEVEVVIWASNPGSRAIKRATLRAHSIRKEVQTAYRLTPAQSIRFRFMGRSWMHSDQKRPVVSIAVSKLL